MFCSKCSTELPGEANFCWKCGQPTSGDASKATPVEYEFCVIELENVGWSSGIYEAWIDDTVIAKSPKFKRAYSGSNPKIRAKETQAKLELISKLMSQGWEPFTYHQDGEVHTMRKAKK